VIGEDETWIAGKKMDIKQSNAGCNNQFTLE